MTTTATPAPQGLCLKTCIYRDGDYLHAITTMVKDGNPEVFKASIDLKTIQGALVRSQQRKHGAEVVKVSGFFSTIASTVAKIGHANVVKNIADDIKRTTGLSAIHTPIVFPAVNTQAAAAYLTAKQTLNTINNANAVANRVRMIAASGTPAAKAAAQKNIPQIKALMAKKLTAQRSLASLANRAKMGDRDALKAQQVFGIVQRSMSSLAARKVA